MALTYNQTPRKSRAWRAVGARISNTRCIDCGADLSKGTGYWYNPDGSVQVDMSFVPASLYYCLPCGDERFCR